MTKVPEMWKWQSADNKDYFGYSDDGNTFNPTEGNIFALGTQFGLYFMMVHFYAPEWVSIVVVTILGFIWEVKNALIPILNVDVATGVYEQRWLGGPGFAWKHEVYGVFGIFLAFLLDVMWPPAIQPSREEEENSF